MPRGPRPPSIMLEERALRPKGRRSTADDAEVVANANDPGDVPPGTVGHDGYTPGDPNGLEIIEEGTPSPWPRSRMKASPWSGYPEDWETPLWISRAEQLADTAWMCFDLNASIMSTMPPYLVGTASSPSTPTDWINNPDPDLYTSWEEFAKQLFWDYQAGEAFVVVTARYSNGYPARFHVVEPWVMNVEMDGGIRSYSIGGVRLADDEVCHIRYKSSTSDARGHGPLEAGRQRLVAAMVLSNYVMNFARGQTPSSLEVERELSAKQTTDLQNQWLESRARGWGLPAVLSGGVKWNQHAINPRDASLFDLSQATDAKIAVMCGVPPFLVGLPSGGDSMTYKNVASFFDFHWRSSLRPKATTVMSALSGWLLPRGSRIEVNRDAYVQPDPLDRAQMYEILIRAGVMTAEQAAAAERVLNTTPADLAVGVMR